MIEDPNSGRAQIYRDSELFQIRLNAKNNAFVTLFILFWLMGWAIGEITVLGILLSGATDEGGINLFLIVWLGGWTIGGVWVISSLMWAVFGYELLSISRGMLSVKRVIPIYRREWNYDPQHITEVRVDPSSGMSPMRFSGRQQFSGLLSGKDQGTLKFDYGYQTFGFGQDLAEAEAKKLVKEIKSKLGLKSDEGK